LNFILATSSAIALCICAPTFAQDDPELSAWRANIDGTKGKSNDPGIHATVSQFDADITSTVFTASYVYIGAEGIPSHEIGPWPGNPNIATGRDWTWRVPRDPQPATNPTETGLGQIGTMVNGVPMFNAKDGRSYRNRGVWEQDAIYFEGQTMDVGIGHPQASGNYHYHSYPELLAMQQGDSPRDHSPILGFAFDGYPVYGPYGYANANGTGGLKRIESSYRPRNITVRDTLPDGTQLSGYYHGPNVSAQFPLGCFVQDFEYVAGLGDLDEFNGRFCRTPEYPTGTFAYFMTLDAAGEPAYPYLIGPSYYGVVDTANIGPGSGHTTPPGSATDYEPLRIYANNVADGGTATISIANAVPNSLLYLAWSITGSGPTSTPWGDVALDSNFNALPALTADAGGFCTLTASIPSGLAGTTIYAQVLNDPGNAGALSLPLRVIVQ
jgi:hypothetical protein